MQLGACDCFLALPVFHLQQTMAPSRFALISLPAPHLHLPRRIPVSLLCKDDRCWATMPFHASHCTSGRDVAIVGRHYVIYTHSIHIVYSAHNGFDAILTLAWQRSAGPRNQPCPCQCLASLAVPTSNFMRGRKATTVALTLSTSPFSPLPASSISCRVGLPHVCTRAAREKQTRLAAALLARQQSSVVI